MKSEIFRCPNCGAQLKKSAATSVLSEADSYIVFDHTRYVTCPACGGAISTEAIIKGEYDDKQIDEGFGCVILILGFILTMTVTEIADSRYGIDLGLFIVIIGPVCIFVVYLVVTLLQELFKKIFH